MGQPMKKISLLLFLIPITAMAGWLQNEDHKSSAEIIADGGVASQMLNTSKIWDDINACSLDTDITNWFASQTGNAGKFLTTNGTNTSWANVSTGTVTSVSVVTANGLAGTVTNPTTNAAITLSTTLTGPLIGANPAITTGTFSGNTTEFGTVSGPATSGQCAQFDVNGNLVAAGAPCSSATPGGANTDVQYNNAGVFGGNGGFTYDGIGTVTATTFVGALTGHASLDLAIANNLSDVANKATSFNNISPMTTSQDIIVGGVAGAGTRLGVGTNGTFLGPQIGILGYNQPPANFYNELFADQGFEAATLGSIWTESGAGLVGSQDNTNFIEGTASRLETLSASTTGNITGFVTPATELGSVNLEFTAWVKTSLTTIQVCAQEGGVTVGTCAAAPSDNNWHAVTLNYPGPISGTIGIKVGVNGTSSTGTFNVDNAYVGPARNLSQVSQSQFYGSNTISCSGAWTVSGATSFSPFPATTGCTYTSEGNAQAPSTFIPAITFASMPPGEYILQYEGEFQNPVTGQQAGLQFWDGTNVSREISWCGNENIICPGFTQSIKYTTTQTNVTLQVRALTGSTGQANLRPDVGRQVIKVYYFPSQSQTAISESSVGSLWSGHFSGGACGWSNSSTTPADFPNATCTFNQDTNQNFGTVSATGATTPGITFTPNVPGYYWVCASPFLQPNNSSLATAAVYLTDGSNNELNRGTARSPGSANGLGSSVQVCGIVNAPSTSPTTVKLRGNTSTGTMTVDSGDISNTQLAFSIFNLSQMLPSPILVGGVTSATAGQEKLERATFGGNGGTKVSPTVCNGTCAIYTQSSAWLTTPTRVSLGEYTSTVNGFTDFPSCTCSAGGTSGSICNAWATSSTTLNLELRSAGGALTDASPEVICMGPH
jgi:hypothetical protein